MRLKILGLAAISAVAAMAFLGASSASAGTTALCTNEGASLTSACTAVTKIHVATVGHMVLLGAINIECNALLSATTDDTLGSSVVFDKEVNLSYSSCLGGCGFSVIQQGAVTVLKTGVELADVTGSGFIVNFKCFGLNCDYDSTNLVGHAVRSGGETHITYDKDNLNVREKLGGFITCPSAGALDALYRSLTDIFIRA